ncbi:cobyrinate a,c-diamide synthase [Laspinema olomoucense]|uniref:cobyrinate a,c-diamide synthase n=1 Tax=Laspinema olomoucense TaxID=3231600 RepID=UPI0021BA52BD|nr:cobyrinate a,c-diamide synthase [Laspinema sp. D3c]MCT7996963.1 cobyrinate a,c-diamide synthase [Laspinema sp. D3c]
MTTIIAGERSGVGKTTITLAILAYLQRQGLKVQSFKVGPDYIDPMFHHYVTGRPCRNLDPVLTSPNYVQDCFNRHLQSVEFALIEGVMGLFDGVQPAPLLMEESPGFSLGDFASSAHIARLLQLPVILVLDCSRLSSSIAAIAQGYRTLDPRVNIAGAILNRVGSDRHLELLQDALETIQFPILGVWRRQDNITIPDRHLGLIPTAELPQLDALIDRLAHLAETCFDWEQLFPLLKSTPATAVKSLDIPNCQGVKSKIPVAIAQDAAFNFYYPDNLDSLESLGAELVPWSPLKDAVLPEGVQGLYLGGGFPEIFAETLGANTPALRSVYQAVTSGMPTYAECGGLMYLCQHLVDFDSKSWPMVGILPANAVMGSRLCLGYRLATTLQDTPLFQTGDRVWGHEFHRSHLTAEPSSPLYQLQAFHRHSGITPEGWGSSPLSTTSTVHASYIHLHWGGQWQIPQRFLQSCQSFDPRSSPFL